MRTIRLTAEFKQDMDVLSKDLQDRVRRTIRKLEENPKHPGLQSEKQIVIRQRTIWRSRINHKYRLLWEYNSGYIDLWRVGNHETIDAITSLPSVADTAIEDYKRKTQTQEHRAINSEASSTIFSTVSDNLLRLFGVSEAALDAVKAIEHPEAIWDLNASAAVKETLYSLVMYGWDEAANVLFNPEKFLYRVNADQLDGYYEGKIQRLMLNLNEEQAALVHLNITGTTLIKGVAGSGKSTIGLYRAGHLIKTRLPILQQAQAPHQSSVLLITFSRTLSKALEQLLTELYGDNLQDIEVRTFDSWLVKHYRSAGKTFDPPTNSKRIELMRQAIRNVSKNMHYNSAVLEWPAEFFLNEIDDVIHGRQIGSLSEYQTIDRHGRRHGLNRQQHRPVVWKIYDVYQQLLHDAGYHDWSELPTLVKTSGNLPTYHAVIIDEAQDLPPSRLQLATQLVDHSNGGSLTLLADPAQSIYYKGIPWKDGGIDVRGRRTRTLNKNYRNTRQILSAAACILDASEDLQTDDYITPTTTDRLGPKPIMIKTDNDIDHVITEVLRLCERRQFRPGDIAILSRTHDKLHALSNALAKADIPSMKQDNKRFDILENAVKLLTMHAAKGLEFPVVFLLGLTDGIVPMENRNLVAEEDIVVNLLTERKLFYVSMTRAAERLYLVYPTRNFSRFIRDLDQETISEYSVSIS